MRYRAFSDRVLILTNGVSSTFPQSFQKILLHILFKKGVLQARNDSSSGFRFITARRLQVPSMLKLVILQVRFKESEASLQGVVQSAVDPLLGPGI